MSKKILIIDDEIDVMKMLVYRLKAKGFEIITAPSGKDGINMAKIHLPDLILLDYRLPDINAPEVSKKLREEESLKHTPIILVTASVQEIQKNAKECQAVEYIAKPIDSEELYAKVERHI